MMANQEKVIIVEGRTDKRQVEKVINEQVEIICTNGTLGVERLEELLLEYDLDNKDVFIMVDEDKAGQKLRKQLSIELPHAKHIFVDKSFREVAATPESVLAAVLLSRRIMVKPVFLI